MESVVTANNKSPNAQRSVAKGVLSAKSRRPLLLPAASKDKVYVLGRRSVEIDSLSASIEKRIVEILKECEKNFHEEIFKHTLLQLEFKMASALTSGYFWNEFRPPLGETFTVEERKRIFLRPYSFVQALIDMKQEGYSPNQILLINANSPAVS